MLVSVVLWPTSPNIMSAHHPVEAAARAEEYALVELEKLVASFLKEPNVESKDFKAATVALKAGATWESPHCQVS